MKISTLALILSVFFTGWTPCALWADSPASPLSERIFAYLDKNGDKSIDSKEFEQSPGSIQFWLTDPKLTGRPPIKKADFLSVFPQMIDDLRHKRTRIAIDNRPQEPPGMGKSPDFTANSSSDQAVVSSKPSPLPAEYQSGDLDKDGQIDFYEWRKFRPEAISKFRELDSNRDAVLSVAELTGTKPALSTKSPTSSSSSSVSKPSAERLETIKYLFGRMDQNKNQKIDPDEWRISRRIRPAFEAKKIDLTKAMSLEQFTTYYQVAFPEQKSRSN
ncbi:MAG: hypothetical protein Tsb009_23820 [Planctomycetaceae bacterium]